MVIALCTVTQLSMRADARSPFRMTMQGAGGDDAALQIKAFQRLQGRGDLLAVGAGARGDR
jgi:hypothetical protein